jgi:hypothetical protein
MVLGYVDPDPLGDYRGQPTVVYSQQCLSATFCLTFQLWPVQEKSV